MLDDDRRQGLEDWLGGFAALARAMPHAKPAVEFREELVRCLEQTRDESLVEQRTTIADYLFDELVADDKRFVVSESASRLHTKFVAATDGNVTLSGDSASRSFVVGQKLGRRVFGDDPGRRRGGPGGSLPRRVGRIDFGRRA